MEAFRFILPKIIQKLLRRMKGRHHSKYANISIIKCLVLHFFELKRFWIVQIVQVFHKIKGMYFPTIKVELVTIRRYWCQNKILVAYSPGMKMHGCSCSYTFAVFDNFNKIFELAFVRAINIEKLQPPIEKLQPPISVFNMLDIRSVTHIDIGYIIKPLKSFRLFIEFLEWEHQFWMDFFSVFLMHKTVQMTFQTSKLKTAMLQIRNVFQFNFADLSKVCRIRYAKLTDWCY